VVEHNTVTRYVATVRGHEVRVDQPLAAGGTDEAPTPVELFVVSLATCVAYYAGRYLERHGLSRAGLAVRAEYARQTDRRLALPRSICGWPCPQACRQEC
jgi:putative redox protein